MINNIDHKRIEKLMKHFNCNSREVEIYLKCLTLTPSTIQELARQLKQNRTTTHSAIDELLKKGFLFETRKGKQRLIAAEPPSIFNTLLQKDKSKVEAIEQSVDYVTSLLSTLQVTSKTRPSIKFNEGVDGLKKMLEETMEAKDGVLVFSNVGRLSSLVGPDYLESYLRRRAEKGIFTRLIFPPGDFANKVNAKKEEYKMEIRLLPPEMIFKSGIFAWNNKIALLSYTEGGVTSTIIENDDISDFFRNIMFELAWLQAKPM